ncbi:ABC-2 family transporter protein [Secundilactobacillus silagincola]|uniref:ABC-2 family transporter protein n=1 Tax=Secundilactobacillus silagincola TaxID=1714681 RepID=A0A1Z5J1W3_9LACO|nr:hypothetical protein [Secundilactobacillus silagincola]GAX07889.1 ABC-2 family transporter protein [Secundilactobacillus silagincola]
MLNMARADTYRLFRSKGFYITQILMIIVATISILTSTIGIIGGGSDALSNFQAANQRVVWTGVQCVKAMSSETSALIYFILPLFIMTIGFEFSRQIYKNPLSSGMTRLNYFISKYVIFLLISACQVIFYYLFIFLAGGFKNGFGKITGHFLVKLLQTSSIQLLELSAIFAISTLVMYLFFSTITAVVTTILFPLIITVLVQIFTKQHWLKYFSFQNNVDSAYFTHCTSGQMSQLLLAGFGTIIVCLVLAFLSFRKRDL